MATDADNTGIFSSAIHGNKTANGKPWVTVFLIIFHFIAPGHRHIVNDPIKKKQKKKHTFSCINCFNLYLKQLMQLTMLQNVTNNYI